MVLDVEVSFLRLMKLWSEIRDICVAAEMVLGVEGSKFSKTGQKLEMSVLCIAAEMVLDMEVCVPRL